MKSLKINIVTLSIFLLFFENIIIAQIIKMPEPVSGKSLTKSIVQGHLVYPQKALDQKLGGKITVLFTVDENGNTYNYHVDKSFDDECAAEAIRLVKQIIWNPATNNALPYKSEYQYLVAFSPKNYLKNIEKKNNIEIPEQKYPLQKSNTIYDFKDLNHSPQPYFKNKNITFGEYLRSELIYPDQAKEFEISGTVKVNFIIETDGMTSNITIEKSVGGGCDNEAIRLIKDLIWIPGVKNDSLVRTRTSQDITFRFGERNYYDGNQY